MSGVSRASNAVADARFTEAVGTGARPTGMYTTLGDSPFLRPMDLEERHYAEAEHFVRRAANRHGCANRHDRDTACTSPGHAGDVQTAVFLLKALGLRDDPETAWQRGDGYRPSRRRAVSGG